jgi:ribonuclease HI
VVRERESSGGEAHTTNNRMEIQAVIAGLDALTHPSRLTIWSDSQYVIYTMTRGWKRKKNHDLWEALDKALAPHQVTWQYVRGHAGHEYNERCDALARQAIQDLKKSRERS